MIEVLHTILPRQLGHLRVFLDSHKDVTPRFASKMVILERQRLIPASRSHLLSVEVPMLLGGGN